jgi:hypothetical protein
MKGHAPGYPEPLTRISDGVATTLAQSHQNESTGRAESNKGLPARAPRSAASKCFYSGTHVAGRDNSSPAVDKRRVSKRLSISEVICFEGGRRGRHRTKPTSWQMSRAAGA